jgi:hypothetical protein
MRLQWKCQESFFKLFYTFTASFKFWYVFDSIYFFIIYPFKSEPGNSVDIATDYGLDGPGIESWWKREFSHTSKRSWGPPSPLYNRYRVFPGGKAAGAWCWPPTPSSAEVMKGYSYTSIHPLGQFRHVTGVLYLYAPPKRPVNSYQTIQSNNTEDHSKNQI